MNRRQFFLTLPAALLGSVQVAQASPARLGLIFVAQSTCPYCAAIAPVLAQLQHDAGIDVLVASLDHRPITPFASFEDGTAHPLTAHYRSVPHVLVYNSGVGRITHEVSGVRTMRHFVQRLSISLRQSSAL